MIGGPCNFSDAPGPPHVFLIRHCLQMILVVVRITSQIRESLYLFLLIKTSHVLLRDYNTIRSTERVMKKVSNTIDATQGQTSPF